jgi:hypothetical protein
MVVGIFEDKSKWKKVTYGYNGTDLVPLKLNASGELVDTVDVASGFEQIVVSNAHSETLTSATYGAATKAMITVEGNSIRARFDGTAPTTTIGHLYLVGATITLTGHDITHFKAIAVGSDATLSVTYSSEA